MLRYSEIFPPEICSFTSDNSFDFSFKNEDCLFEKDQKQFLTTELIPDVDTLVNIKQVHGNRIINVNREIIVGDIFLGEADGIITSLPGVALLIRTADCLPVLFYDEENKCIGIAHAGWKGTQLRIAEEIVMKMQSNFSSCAENIKVAFGPAIRGCCYQVGEEFVKYFPEDTNNREGKLFFDLVSANKNQLKKRGVKEENIFDSQECSCCGANFFSYRKEGEAAGRMLSLILLKA